MHHILMDIPAADLDPKISIPRSRSTILDSTVDRRVKNAVKSLDRKHKHWIFGRSGNRVGAVAVVDSGGQCQARLKVNLKLYKISQSRWP